MSEVVIRAEAIGKRYRIGKPHKLLTETVLAMLSPQRGSVGEPSAAYWALEDVSFEIKRGEVMGIVGANGAGKSTLLKILSRITPPTTGRASITGRVGTLLEVGTGFHPELTGRENIFLNAAVLGMRRHEVQRRLDEIIDFSGVEKFIDTPVKRYSSGMYTRLAFAVAAHLDSEILIVDEVLAVGDAAFQRKSMRKVDDSAQQGRTVLFVSHNAAALRQLCTRAMLLERGRLTAIGTPDEVIETYWSKQEESEDFHLTPVVDLPAQDGQRRGCVSRLAFFHGDGRSGARFSLGEPWWIVLEFQISEPLEQVIGAVAVSNVDGMHLGTYWSDPRDLTPGHYRVKFRFDLPLTPTKLQFGVGLSCHGMSETVYHQGGLGTVAIERGASELPPFGHALVLMPDGAQIELAEDRTIASATSSLPTTHVHAGSGGRLTTPAVEA